MTDKFKALRDALDIAEDLAAAQLADARQAYAGWPQKIAPAEREVTQVAAGRAALDALLAEVAALRKENADLRDTNIALTEHYDGTGEAMDALRNAAQAVVDRWDSPQWKWAKQGPTADVINDLRAALRAKEESRG